MALFNATLMIRESRKAQGLTQEQLADGICSRETVAKLEAGQRKPNWFVMNELMLKLGLNPDIYQEEIVSDDEIYIYKTWSDCYVLLNEAKVEEAKSELDRIEAEKNSPSGKMWRSDLGHRLLLQLKASFYSLDVMQPDVNKYLNPSLSIDYAMEYLRIARPDFEI